VIFAGTVGVVRNVRNGIIDTVPASNCTHAHTAGTTSAESGRAATFE
jgi:hypothetical protein